MSNVARYKNLIVLLILVVVGWVSYARLYDAPIEKLELKLANIRSNAASFKKGTPSVPAINRARRALESTVLSVEQDEFEHLLRTRLSALVGETGLREVVVSHKAPKDVMSPVLGAKIQKAYKAQLSKGPIFKEVRGKITGQGTPEILSATLSLIQSQTWVHRIESVKITPNGKQRRLMQIDLGFVVLFSPSASLPDDHTPPQTIPEPAVVASALSLASRPLFRPPDPEPEPPKAVAKQPVKPKPKPTPQDAYWRVTGLITEPTPEVWMVHSTNAKQRVLTLGQRILNATIVGIYPDHAQILIGEQRFRVPLGRTLAERQPITEEEPSK